MELTLGSYPKTNSNLNSEVVEELNVWFCMELSVSLEVRKVLMLMIIVQIYPMVA